MEQDNEITTEEEKIKQISDLLTEMSAEKSILCMFYIKRYIRYSLFRVGGEVWL